MKRHVWRVAAAVAGLTALAVGGSAIAGAATSSGSHAPAAPAAPSSMPAHGSAAHEDAEKPVTGDAATKAKAAALAFVGGGTAGDVTTDFVGNGYEVTVTKADGSTVEVHLDSSFDAMQFGGPPPPSTGA